MITVVGITFPREWLWGSYEEIVLDALKKQIDRLYPDQQNLLINLTWFGPQFSNNGWQQVLDLAPRVFDNLFLLATVDPPMINPDQIQYLTARLGHPKLHKIGNFDTEYHFNFFAPILARHFAHYDRDQLLMQQPKYLYINYNRKPREHRVKLVKLLIDLGLDHRGILTLGRPNPVYDKDPNNQLYLSIGEREEDYVHTGHWYHTGESEFGIPHDILSLHRIDLWQNHFLHIIGATEFNHWDDIFVSETQFKPMIGLRPFVINGNARTYKWLRDNGFLTFERWFPNQDFDDVSDVHGNIVRAVQYLSSLADKDIIAMYQDMLPSLDHNRHRFYEYANEQSSLMTNILQGRTCTSIG
jgi:hypothetical protein